MNGNKEFVDTASATDNRRPSQVQSSEGDCLGFDIKLVRYSEITSTPMSYFDTYCKDFNDKTLDSTIDLLLLAKIKKDLDEMGISESSAPRESCLEMLGVYFAPGDESKQANIIMCPERILDVAKRLADDVSLDQINTMLAQAVKIHEEGHAGMCPVLHGKELLIERDAHYVFIEESLATAIMLHKMKGDNVYVTLESFVKQQPIQYRYGLVLVSRYDQEQIEELMCFWKELKGSRRGKENYIRFFSCLISDEIVCYENLKKSYLRTSNILLQKTSMKK